MSKQPRARLLDVGNCGPDHSMIRRMLERNFDVDIDQVMYVKDAVDKMQYTKYDLVLFNRLIFDDGSDGIELLRQSRSNHQLPHTPMMMISNFEAAQAASIAAGGVPGFGKDSLFEPQTIAILAQYLPKATK